MKNKHLVLLLIIAAILLGKLQPYMEEYCHRNTEYIFTIRSEHELTEDNVKELGKLSGMIAFYPVATYPVTLQLKNYTMSVELKGVDYKDYPLVCKSDGTIGVHLGNQPVLLIGDSVWKEFADSFGHGALTDQIEKWSEQYRELTFSMQGEDVQMQTKASIGAIVATEDPVVYIDNTQLEEWLASNGAHAIVCEGCIKMRGLHQVKEASKLITDCGLTVGEWKKVTV